MTAIINGDSPSVTFSDGTTQATSAIVSGKVPYSTLPAGSVLQVVSTTKTSSASVTATSPTALSGMSATITPKSASNKILIQVAMNCSIDTVGKRIYFTISGGNAANYIGDAGTGQECAMSWCPRSNDTYTMLPANMLYLDSPATTSAITYQVNWWMESNTGYLNRPATIDANGANMASTITVMEIAG
jgi:hypothetical protein